ncbi:carbohydrate-selective porin OprB [Gloeomargarita lithophora Alchichica-D10]|uniref:Carbohydrate-selective porin OprB n=1 Tax=Gloeomargarita lithophora Alchichica-D10 TaxID=1188229 RepID=A0A1J0AFH6_9CYAN|nr:iron uptake porin [Gloeomargarita lithophora]APB34692.1 carbohydrate-selective porin OprB [Gloeomargarita lithophora Alchichica-D10]
MSKKFMFKLLATGSLAMGVSLAMAGEAQAQITTQNSRESINQVREYIRELKEDNELGQVTSVSEFVDVKPTDWAFLALQSLVERYGCIVGLPTNPPTYQGRRATTRYEFAAGLNACLDRINELIAASVENLVTKEDLKLLQRLQEEFAAELALLRGRVDTLEARTATLEAQQFSTTTKLSGQVILAAQGAFGGNQAVPKGVPQGAFGNIQDATTFGYRVNLNFNTSFTGKDLLLTTIQMDDVTLGAGAAGVTGTNNSALGYSFLNRAGGGVAGLWYLSYTFPVLADKGSIYITGYGGGVNDYVDTLSPLNDDGQGALSGFGLRNPLYNQNLALGVGAGFNYNFLDDKLNFAIGYLANGNAGGGAFGTVGTVNPAGTEGLFGSSFNAFVQLTGYPTDNLGLSVLYIRSGSDPDSGLAINYGGGVGTAAVDAVNVGTSQADNVGFQFKWQPLKNFILGGWFGATWFAGVSAANAGTSGTALNYALVFAFPDVGTKGSQAQIVVGAPPYLTNSTGLVANGLTAAAADDVPILVEGSYRFKFTEYLSITPGIIAIFSPEGNSANSTVLVGVIRSTFSF